MAGRQESLETIMMTLHHIEVLHERGQSVTEAVRQVGITQLTYHRWRRQYGGMSRDEFRWMRQLMDESRWAGATIH